MMNVFWAILCIAFVCFVVLVLICATAKRQDPVAKWRWCRVCKYFYDWNGGLAIDPSLVDAEFDGVVVPGICPECCTEFQKISPRI